jgi:hypothetical protein
LRLGLASPSASRPSVPARGHQGEASAPFLRAIPGRCYHQQRRLPPRTSSPRPTA